MVIDDDESVRTILSTILGAAGHQVVALGDGAEALDRMREGPLPALVLLDLMMPKMGGWQVLEAMRESPSLSRVPVVVLTAFGDPSELPSPHMTILHKPVEAPVLRELVAEVLTAGTPPPHARPPAHS
jgi:CheY-like chemotaxis protein